MMIGLPIGVGIVVVLLNGVDVGDGVTVVGVGLGLAEGVADLLGIGVGAGLASPLADGEGDVTLTPNSRPSGNTKRSARRRTANAAAARRPRLDVVGSDNPDPAS